MAKSRETSFTSVQIIDEQTTFTLKQLCRSCAVEAEFIEQMVAQGVLEPMETEGLEPVFSAQSLKLTRVAVRLQRDLGVNPAGAALAIDLLERIDELDARLRALTGASS